MLLIFKSAVTTDTTFYLYADEALATSYTGNDSGSMLGAAEPSLAGSNNQVFRAEFAGTRTKSYDQTSTDLFYLKSYSYDAYLACKSTVNGASALSMPDRFVLTTDKTKAAKFSFASGSGGQYGGGSSIRRNGWAAEHWGAGRYNGTAKSNRENAVCIAYNPDEMPMKYGTSDVYLTIQSNINTYCSDQGAKETSPVTLDRTKSACHWNMYEVEMISGTGILQNILDEYTAAGHTPEAFAGGTAPGLYDQAAATAFATAWNAIENAIANGSTPTDEEIEALRNNLSSAFAAVQPTMNNVTEGYYAIISADTTSTTQKALTGGTTLFGSKGLAAKPYSNENALQVFQAVAAANGFYLRNAATRFYINVPGAAEANTTTPTSAQAFTKIDKVAGQFAISNMSMPAQFYSAKDSTIAFSALATANSATAWKLVPIDADKAMSLINGSASLRDKMSMDSLILAAKERISQTDTVLEVDEYGYLYNASQLSTNTTNQSLKEAIDEDVNTYFDSNMNRAEDTRGAHYLTADFSEDGGIVGDLVFRAVRRREGQSYYVNDWPEVALITASTNGTKWDTIRYVDLGNEGVEKYTSPLIRLSKTYRYLRFTLVKNSQDAPNSKGQYAFSLAEFNWYDAYIDYSSSASRNQKTQAQLANLKLAVQRAERAVSPTQDDIAALQRSLDTFNDAYDKATAIKTARNEARGNNTTNVYTTDGVLVRRGANIDTATDGLPKGLYVVSGKKILVK